MYRFSKKEDYAFILIAKLTQNYKKRLISLSEIAKEYNISPLFLRNLANNLRNNKIIGAIEGAKGGYFLLKNPKKIKVGEILNSLSSKALFECCSSRTCPREKICPAGFSWRKINKEFLDKIYNLSFTEFINKK